MSDEPTRSLGLYEEGLADSIPAKLPSYMAGIEFWGG